jgi:hypothetical protein
VPAFVAAQAAAPGSSSGQIVSGAAYHISLRTTPTTSPAGAYVATAPASDAAHRSFLLRLSSNGEASLKTIYGGNDQSSIARGHWAQSSDRLTLSFDPLGNNPPARPIIFRQEHDTLIPKSWDTNEWGSKGPPNFHRVRATNQPDRSN